MFISVIELDNEPTLLKLRINCGVVGDFIPSTALLWDSFDELLWDNGDIAEWDS